MRTVDRILATSDLHGQNNKTLDLLKESGYEPDKDLLVICGDLIDRGTQNLACIATCQKLQQKGAVLLKGNHEQFLEQSLVEMLSSDARRTNPSENLYNWVKYNGGATMYEEIENLSSNKLTKLLKFVQSLRLYFAVGNFIFTHAGANIGKPIEENTENELVWMENRFPYSPAYKGKVLIFGHEPTWKLYSYDKKFKKSQVRIWYDTTYKDKIGIDTGGVFGGRLAALWYYVKKKYNLNVEFSPINIL